MEAGTEWVTRRPAPQLARYVERYVGYRLTGFAAGVHRGLPSRHMTMIASIGPAIDVIAQTDPAQAPDSYRCVIGGLQASHALIAHDGDQEGVAIELTPVGSRALLGLPAAELWNASLELSDVVGAPGTELWERLQYAGGWDERFRACDDVLGRTLGDDSLEPALRRAWQLIAASEGSVRVAEVAHTIGWTRQHLARRFTHEFGLAPKLAARIVRFERARRMLGAPFPTIAEVAGSCGYFDQPHMTRDFVELGGSPPGQLLTDLPSVQDEADAGARA